MNRELGILLHITSLPSKFGVGTLGKECFKFVDWLKKSNVKVWQVLPLAPTSFGDSPYKSIAPTAFNHYLIDLELLKEKKLLLKEELDPYYNLHNERVDYSFLYNNKIKLLKKAFSRISINIWESNDFLSYLKDNDTTDYAIFSILKEHNNYKPWYLWDDFQKYYSDELKNKIINDYWDEFLFWQWTQYEVQKEWLDVKKYANRKGIKIMVDLPFYLEHDSVELWRNRDLFMLNEDGSLKVLSGYKSANLSFIWDKPVCNWEQQKLDNYSFWRERLNKELSLFDIVKIDNFGSFMSYYSFENKASKGELLKGPGASLFEPNLNIVIDNLDELSDEDKALIKPLGYKNVIILERAFSEGINSSLGSSAIFSNIIYTGIHDNKPLYQFFKDLNKDEYKKVYNIIENECQRLNIDFDTTSKSIKYLTDIAVEIALASRASLAVIPMQDLLHQDGKSRMNSPIMLNNDNWSYRIHSKALSKELSERIRDLIKKYNR